MDARRARRESIESIVVVFLAFLLSSLEAQGYVIPTGSMAPTLMGRHKEIVCPECGHTYTVNADCEVDSNTGQVATGLRVLWATCENCRFETSVAEEPSVAGDRVYAMKRGLGFPFLPSAGAVGPKRWEVTVFKLPESPEILYIKRMIGEPGEIVRIAQGDLWRRPLDGSEPFRRLRRPSAHQQATQVLVYDDAHRPRSLANDPRWRRWVSSDDAWMETEPGRFVPDRSRETWSELRYRHMVPDPEQWKAIREGTPVPTPPRPTLITDFCSYNTDLTREGQSYARLAARPWFQPHWVGDLTISAEVNVREPKGALRVELIRGGVTSRCEIDLSTGQATLIHDGGMLGPSASTTLSGKGRHTLTFANVDHRLFLRVDGRDPFGDGRECDPEKDAESVAPTKADLEPVRIAARGADVDISALKLERDVYYTVSPTETDYEAMSELPLAGPRAFFDLLADPDRYASLGTCPRRDFPLGPGRYLMLGDNSPWSRDGRAWSRIDQTDTEHPGQGWDSSGRESWEVPESLIIGKAFCVYWPHLKPVWPGIRLGPDLRLPARPYLERIRWIR
jgi:signal peptidase I